MKRIILFTFFLTSLCVHSFGKDKFESPNHQLSAEVNGQSVTLYDKSKQMVTRIHLDLITDQGNLDSCLVLKQSCTKERNFSNTRRMSAVPSDSFSFTHRSCTSL